MSPFIRKKKQGGQIQWAKSTFLDNLKTTNFSVPERFIDDGDETFDVAWAEIDKPGDNFVDLNPKNDEKNEWPSDIELYFRAPYDKNAGNPKDRTLASINAVMYVSPGGFGLFEALNIGFRGMSGAIAFERGDSPEKKCVGMFVRMGRSIPLKKSKGKNLTDTDTATLTEKATLNFLNDTAVATSFISAGKLSNNSDRDSVILSAILEKIDSKFDSLRTDILNRFDIVDKRFDFVDKELFDTLKRNDIKEILTVAAMKRGS